ncbi:MAG: hypothetical protein COX20_11295 [Desulfobacterales bacterium CG23_combo_of_CG06-09_8_20_14_all_52_9]|nr:MAG: hypothetical protein COX20_11295 [Desulfobacterales bacterium CG23_combo_of_CG06-09_8_20_14_all_52_9]
MVEWAVWFIRLPLHELKKIRSRFGDHICHTVTPDRLTSVAFGMHTEYPPDLDIFILLDYHLKNNISTP